MSKKHFIQIARDIKRARGQKPGALGTIAVIDGLAEDLADTFAQCNPRFDRRRFLDACGVPA